MQYIRFYLVSFGYSHISFYFYKFLFKLFRQLMKVVSVILLKPISTFSSGVSNKCSILSGTNIFHWVNYMWLSWRTQFICNDNNIIVTAFDARISNIWITLLYIWKNLKIWNISNFRMICLSKIPILDVLTFFPKRAVNC